MKGRKRPYLAYLVRLWQVRDEGLGGWRASVEDAHTGERWGFAGPLELLAFLQEQIGICMPVNGLEKDERTPKTSFESKEN